MLLHRDHKPITGQLAMQAAEIDRRLATLDEGIKDGYDAAEALAELRRRYL